MILARFALRNVAKTPASAMQMNSVAKSGANMRATSAATDMMPATPTTRFTPNRSLNRPATKLNKMPAIMAEEKRMENWVASRLYAGITRCASGESWYWE